MARALPAQRPCWPTTPAMPGGLPSTWSAVGSCHLPPSPLAPRTTAPCLCPSITTEPGSGVDGVVAAWNDTVRLAPYGAGAYWGNLPVAAADAAGGGGVPWRGRQPACGSARRRPGRGLPAGLAPGDHRVSCKRQGSARVQRGVLVPNAFMRAVEAGETSCPCARPGTGGAVSAVPAQAVWDALLLARAGRALAAHPVCGPHQQRPA